MEGETVAALAGIIEALVGPDWLAEAGLTVDGATRFSSLSFDPLDEVVTQKRINDVFGIHYPSSAPLPDTVGALASIIDQLQLRPERLAIAGRFFSDGWRKIAGAQRFDSSGLIAEMQARSCRRVLDIGCGDNLLKPYFSDVVGIDVANERADFCCDFLEYEADVPPFDAIVALGSINFGTEADILLELHHARAMVAPEGRMYMRVNPGIRWPQCPELDIYPWSRDRIHGHGAATGFAVEGEIREVPGVTGNRLIFAFLPV